MNNEIDKKLLKAYLEGTLSQQEASELLKSIKDDEYNKRYLLELKELSMQMNAGKDSRKADTRKEWNRFRRAMRIQDRSRTFTILSLSACILFLLFCGSYAGMKLGERKAALSREVAQVRIETGIGERVSTILPDGSTIKMNACSKLSYDPEEWIEERIVYFTGEGSFDITHDEEQPFIVNTGRYKVKVLGTSFSLSSYPDSPTDQVSLKSGSVSVFFGRDRSMQENLMPGKSFILDTKDGSYSIIDTEESMSGWERNEIIFEGQSLSEKKEELYRHYGYTFIISPECDKMHYKATVRDESINEMLSLFKLATPELRYNIDNEKKTVRIYID